MKNIAISVPSEVLTISGDAIIKTDQVDLIVHNPAIRVHSMENIPAAYVHNLDRTLMTDDQQNIQWGTDGQKYLKSYCKTTVV